MKDFNNNLKENNDNLEISIEKEQEYKLTLNSTIIPHENHTLYEMDNHSLCIKEATFKKKDYVYNPKWVKGSRNGFKGEVIINTNKTYISALNKKSALSKFNKGENGSKIDTTKDFLKL